MSTVCRLVDVELGYGRGDQRQAVLRGVHADIQAGTCVALFGRSGCGKSSLLNAIAGLEAYDHGEIWHQQQCLHQLNDDEKCHLRAQRLGIVYQAFNLLPTLTVREQLALRLELVGASSEQYDRIDHLLAAVGLADRDHSHPDELSGGEQQRVAIAAALVHRPALVLADEPTGNLDGEQASRALDLLLELRQAPSSEHGSAGALVIATHDEGIAERADVVWRLDDGVIRVTE